MGFRVDVDGLERWEADHAAMPAELDEQIRKVTGRGAFNVKRDWKARWTGYRHIPYLPNAISYDLERAPGGGWVAEIGPDKHRRQGPLGNVIEFGTINNAPIPGGLPALDVETPRFERALADAAEKVLGGGT